MNKSTLLVIDIGNTSVSVGVWRDKSVTQTFFIDSNLSAAAFGVSLEDLLKKIKRNYPAIRDVIICSVVPDVTVRTERIIKRSLEKKPILIGRDLIVPIKNNYKNPKQVGQDRLVCAYAAKILYGYPVIIIDFGTAITFDVVNARGDYDGGIIVPGIRLSAESLFNKTALLPRIETINAPRRLIGQDTTSSILSGLFFGYGAMSDRLIDLLCRQLNAKAKVIVTGGYTDMMQKFLRKKIHKIDKHLVFRGMDLLYQIKN